MPGGWRRARNTFGGGGVSMGLWELVRRQRDDGQRRIRVALARSTTDAAARHRKGSPCSGAGASRSSGVMGGHAGARGIRIRCGSAASVVGCR
ncbi:hypothetical protein GUJ93_ZPchr0010g9489 [Zizania palustris]|uniref:Uncharacterized protein n=1 Tax=Zizania palustris TaxID=103762 RepID=A0A8J5WFP6_ZIZPA|nr:hypothetical protein GUJ93_ZPchr0010g9489 [Zizania palustris]